MKKLNITRTLNMAFTGLTMTAVVLFSLYYVAQRHIIAESYHRLSGEFTDNMYNYTQHLLTGYERQLQSLTSTFGKYKDIDVILTHPDKTKINLALNLMPQASALIISDMNGRFIRFPELDKKAASADFNPLTRPWFIPSASFDSRAKFVPPYSDTFTRQEWFSVSSAIFDRSGLQSGVAAVAIKTPALMKKLERFKGPALGRLRLVEEGGRVIMGPEIVDKSVLKQISSDKGYFETNNAWIYYHRLDYPVWYLAYEFPKNEFYTRVRNESMAVVYSACFALIMLFICWGGMHYVAGRIESILTGAILRKKPRSDGTDLSSAMEDIRKQRRELRTQAMHDGLTGLLNRRAFDRLLEDLQENPRSCCIALLDIDNFKSINDRWGHLKGDEVLQRLSSLAEEHLNQGEIRVFRYGGEEIAIVFLEVSPDRALEALEKLRVATASQEWRHGPERVTFSAGFSSCDDLGIHAVLRKVDELLYEAKRQGKNRIVSR